MTPSFFGAYTSHPTLVHKMMMSREEKRAKKLKERFEYLKERSESEKKLDLAHVQGIYEGLKHWIGIDKTVKRYVESYINPYLMHTRLLCSEKEAIDIEWRNRRSSLFRR